MIEVFDARRTRSFGCFASFSVAKGTLDLLARDGTLGQVPSVRVMAYRNGELCRDYEAVFAAGKWRVPKAPKTEKHIQSERANRLRRRRKLCKEYATAELMFREGFPDWMNRSYPLSADSLRKCNRKCRIYGV